MTIHAALLIEHLPLVKGGLHLALWRPRRPASWPMDVCITTEQNPCSRGFDEHHRDPFKRPTDCSFFRWVIRASRLPARCSEWRLSFLLS